MESWKLERVTRFKPLPREVGINLRRYEEALLSEICTNLHFSLGTRRDMAEAVESFLENDEALKGVIRSLDGMDWRFLRLVESQSHRRLSSHRLLRWAELIGIDVPEHRWKKLVKRALLVIQWTETPRDKLATRDLQDGEFGPPCFVPASVLRFVPPLPEEASPFAPRDHSSGSKIHRSDPVRFLREFELILEYLVEHPVEITRQRSIKARYLSRLTKELAVYLPDFNEKRQRLFLHLFRLLGLLESDQELVERLGPQGQNLLDADPEVQLGTLLSAFCHPQFELAHLDYFHQDHRELFRTPYGEYQGMQLRVGLDWSCLPDLLCLLPGEQWVNLRDLVEAMGRCEPFWFFRYAPTFHPAGRPPRPSKPNPTQTEVQRIILTGFIEEIAFPLGLVRWAVGPQKDLMVMLTPLGRQVFGMPLSERKGSAQKKKTAVEAPLVIQPNFDCIVYTEHLSLKDYLRLQRLGVPEAEEGYSPVHRMRLTRESFYRALDHESDSQKLISWLEALCARPLPGNVKSELEEWRNRMECLVLHRGLDLVESSGPASAKEMEDQWFGSKVIGTRFVLASRRSDDIAPMVDYAEKLEPCLWVTPEGRLTLMEGKVLDLKGQELLARLARECGPGEWKLDEARVKKCKWPIFKVIEDLSERVNDLPPALHARLLGWSGKENAIPVQTMDLIEINDEILLRAVMDLPAARALVMGPLNGRYLLVSKENRAKLESALSEYRLRLEARHDLELSPPSLEEAATLGLHGFRVHRPENLNDWKRIIESGREVDLWLEGNFSATKPHEPILLRGRAMELFEESRPRLRFEESRSTSSIILELKAILAVRELF